MGLSIILVLYVHNSLAPALTEMVEFFDTDYAVVSWVLTAYMIAGAASTIVIGKLADMYGAKKMLLLVLLCYTVGTALAGFSQEIYTLLVLRVLQGIAVALVPISVRIARELYPPKKFPMAQGVILSMYQAGSAIGLVLGARGSILWRLAICILFSNTICHFVLFLALEIYSKHSFTYSTRCRTKASR